MSLMLTGSNEWDKDLIMDIFNSLILLIPIRNDTPDSWYWYWRKEKMGNYSVRSAYVVIQESKEGSHTIDNSRFWRYLWNLKVPPKIKNFLWRALTGCIPTKDQLRLKHVNVNALCPVCNVDVETIDHILINCSLAKACWDTVENNTRLHAYNNFVGWLTNVFKQCTNEEIRVRVMICWALWKCRNEVVWNQKGMDVHEIVALAKSILDQWQYAQDKSFDNSLGFITQADGSERWRRPNVDTIKINVDAALFEATKSYSYAIVARNHNGNLIEAMSSCRSGNLAPEMAEAIGIKEALRWVKQKGWQGVQVETDCLLVAQAIRCSSVRFSYLGRIIDDRKQLLSELNNQSVSLIFVKRSANRVAHYLARYNCSVAERNWCGDNAHSEFMNVMMNDC